MRQLATVGRAYTVDSHAGKGGMGTVYKAHDRTGLTVAIKILHETSESGRARFWREAEVLRSLEHPAIVRCLDAGVTSDGEPFLVMEWLEGCDLKQWLARSPLPVETALALAWRIADALATLHSRGGVHRDIKPSNIFMCGDDVADAKLIDFGIARWQDASRVLTATGAFMGTLAYMAPEQVRGDRAVDARADVFSLGCVLYECVAGKPAFDASHPFALLGRILLGSAPRASSVVAHVPAAVDQLIERMLAKEPELRPQDGQQLVAEIERVQAMLDATVKTTMFGPADPEPSMPEVITGTEQHVISVVLAAPAGVASMTLTGATRSLSQRRAAAKPDDPADEGVTVTIEAGNPGIPPGMMIERLPDGSVVVVADMPGSAIDQALGAARYSLSLQRELPDMLIVLATGSGIRSRSSIMGEVMDRAAGLLCIPDVGARRSVRIDEVTAGLIEAHCEIARDELGYILREVYSGSVIPPRLTPFVGRTREIGMLEAILAECIEEKVARAAVVIAPPGLGKTRLLGELLRGLDDRYDRMTTWISTGDSMRAGSPLYMMAQAIRHAAGITDSDALEVRRAQLETWIAARVPAADRERVLAFVGELVGAPAANDSVMVQAARLDPALMADQVRLACEDVIAAEAGKQPLLLILDDVQWGDRATMQLLDQALRNLCEAPLMVLAFGRPEVCELFPRLWEARHAVEIQLSPLPRRAGEMLARAMLDPSISQARVDLLVQHSSGNPFYLQELARNAAAGRWELPETIRAVIHSRLTTLDPSARLVLRAASVFGSVFWLGALEALVGDALALEDWLEHLIDRELITAVSSSRFPGQREFRFCHDLVREGAYAMLTEGDRLVGHRLASQWLEQAGESDPRLLAGQLERGNELERAGVLYLRAAEAALEASDLTAAMELAEHGERCGARGAVLGGLRRVQGGVSVWRGDNAGTARLFTEAMELLPRGSRAWYDAASEAALAWTKLGELARADEVTERLCAASTGSDERLGRLVATAKLSAQLCYAGRAEAAALLLDELEAEIGDLGRAERVVAAHVHRARAFRVAMSGADPVALVRELGESTACFEELGDMRQSCLDRGNLAYAKTRLGLFAEAEADIMAALKQAERLGLEFAMCAAWRYLGAVRAHQGRLDEACMLETRAIAWYAQGGDKIGEGAARLVLSSVLVQLGDIAGARTEALAAVELMNDHPEALAGLACVYLAAGQASLALTASSMATAALQREGASVYSEHEVRLVHAQALAASGRGREARELIEAAARLLVAEAARIEHPGWQRCFLGEVRAHERLLALAAAPASR